MYIYKYMYIYNNVKVYIYMLSMCLCTTHPHWDSIHPLPFHLHPPFSISSPFYPFFPFPFFFFAVFPLTFQQSLHLLLTRWRCRHSLVFCLSLTHTLSHTHPFY